MKTVLLFAVSLGFTATTASAAVMHMHFWDYGDPKDEIWVAVGQMVDVGLWIDLLPGETLDNVYGEFEPEANLHLWDTSAVAAGWNAGGEFGDLGPGLARFVFGASAPQYQLSGPGSFLLGMMTIYFGENIYDWEYELMFTSTPGSPNLDIINAAGASYTWHPGYAYTYSGYYTYGKGASSVPGVVKQYPDLEADPLILRIPEPAGLSLLVLGSLVALRRRR